MQDIGQQITIMTRQCQMFIDVIKNRRKFTLLTFGMLLFFLSIHRTKYFQKMMSNSINSSQLMSLGNLRNFTFVLMDDSICESRRHIDVIFIIPSHPKHLKRREILRKVYNREIKDIGITTIFLMGTPENFESRKKINEEFLLHKDIIQGNFNDSYLSVAYNHLQGLKFGTMFCQNAHYIIKSDDDIFVNLPTLISMLFRNDGEFDNKLFCPIFTNSPVIRNKKSKYYVSKEEYPYDYFPTYCSGLLVVYPLRVAKTIERQASRSKFVWMSDAFITGVAVKNTAILLADMGENFSMDNKYMMNLLLKSNNTPPKVYGSYAGDDLQRMHNISDSLYTYKQISNFH